MRSENISSFTSHGFYRIHGGRFVGGNKASNDAYCGGNAYAHNDPGHGKNKVHFYSAVQGQNCSINNQLTNQSTDDAKRDGLR